MHDDFFVGIICFHPDPISVYSIIDKFNQKQIIIYNNGGSEFILSKYSDIRIIGNGENCGVSYALNQIVKEAISLNCRYLLLSDQDTSYPDSYVEKMLPTFQFADDIGAVLPAWLDLNSNSIISKKQYVYSRFKLNLKYILTQRCVISHGITSGMIIDLYKVSNIDYDEALFIDWVDNDWCWRIYLQSNLKCVFNSDVTLVHQLGESVKNIFGIEFTTRSPLRDYYIIRNAVYLFIHKENLFSVKFYLLQKIIHHIIFSTIFSLRNNLGIRHVILALKDAFYLRMYKCSHKL